MGSRTPRGRRDGHKGLKELTTQTRQRLVSASRRNIGFTATYRSTNRDDRRLVSTPPQRGQESTIAPSQVCNVSPLDGSIRCDDICLEG